MPDVRSYAVFVIFREAKYPENLFNNNEIEFSHEADCPTVAGRRGLSVLAIPEYSGRPDQIINGAPHLCWVGCVVRPRPGHMVNNPHTFFADCKKKSVEYA